MQQKILEPHTREEVLAYAEALKIPVPRAWQIEKKRDLFVAQEYDYIYTPRKKGRETIGAE